MKADIYKAQKIPGPTERRYVFIPSDKSPGFLPDEVMQAAGALNFEKKISIRPGEDRIALNTDEAVREKGFHIVCRQEFPAGRAYALMSGIGPPNRHSPTYSVSAGAVGKQRMI